MFSWSCTCGEEGASWHWSHESARRAAELHLLRMGSNTHRHQVHVREVLQP